MATTWNRRDFLKTGSAATLAALAAGAPMASMLSGCSLTGSKIKPTADTVILLWMAGGMAHTETFYPKHYEPYKKGMDATGDLSTFPSIPTSVAGVSFSEQIGRASGRERGCKYE